MRLAPRKLFQKYWWRQWILVDPDGISIKAEYKNKENKTPEYMKYLEDWRMVKSNYF